MRLTWRPAQAYLTGLPVAGTRKPVSTRAMHTLPLAQRDDLGNGYHVLWFDSEVPVAASAGQFTMVRASNWGEAPLLPRPMSLLSGGRRPSMLIKVVGEGTRRMAQDPMGQAYNLLAPLGHPWTPLPAGHRPVLVAGGVGVAPLVYLAEELRAAQGVLAPMSLYGGRTARDLPLAERLEACGELAVTTEDGSRGTEGRVTVLLDELLAKAAGCGDKLAVYTCGPHGMMRAVAERAEAAGVWCRASLEAPMGCGYGVCLGCPVAKRDGSYFYTCVDGPCVDAKHVDWTKEVF
ncbi:MAG: hypothetical protein VB934_09140 [Polyangiaceae bacterium]